MTVNQLILGRYSTATPIYPADVAEDALACNRFQQDLLNRQCGLYKERVFPYLLPYYRYKDARRDKNLQVGDVCNLKYENKIKSTYRICVVRELFYSEEGVVRTVKVGYRSRRQL